MTAKEKALELREKCDGYACYAEIAVNEIIKQLSDDWGDNQWRANDYIGYWKQVKQEIEKL